MNVRKPTDYSPLFSALDALMSTTTPQMKLYCEVGRLVSSRPEKGAAVAAAEYLQSTYPDATGLSPRNLRRMRNFYRTYENSPDTMTKAMTIGWTQNVVILEAELTLQEKPGIFDPFSNSSGPNRSWQSKLRPLPIWKCLSTRGQKRVILRKTIVRSV